MNAPSLSTLRTLVFVWLILPSVALAAPPSSAMLAHACTGCHGTFGASTGPSIPSLAGQPSDCLVKAMHDFRSDARAATVMGRLAKAYSDGEIVALAEYFSRQQSAASLQPGKGCSSA